ncbi:MAG TPA: GAF domain-containing protein, partial [Kofleriaceae bacterium]
MEHQAIVVLGGSEDDRSAVVSQISASGLPAQGVRKLTAADGLPGLIVICGDSVVELVAEAREVPALAETPILALCPAMPQTILAAALAAGATDVARWPAPSALLIARCRNMLKLSRRDAANAQALSKINDVLTADGDDAEALIQVLQITASVLGFDRASLIAHIDGSDHAFVIAASDAEPMTRFTLAINEYPEVVETMRTGQPLLIDDVLTHTVTARIGELLSSRGVRGVAVFPVQWRARSL